MGAADGCKNLANRAIKIEGYRPGKDRKKQTYNSYKYKY